MPFPKLSSLIFTQPGRLKITGGAAALHRARRQRFLLDVTQRREITAETGLQLLALCFKSSEREAFTGSPVCGIKWECFSAQLVPSKYFSDAGHRQFIIDRSALSPLSPLPDAWAITALRSQCMLGDRRGTQGTTIYSSASCVFSSFHSSTRRTPVSRPGGSAAMARLGLPVVLLLCFSLLHLGSGRPPRTRKALSPRQSGGNAHEIRKSRSWPAVFAPLFTRRACVCVWMLLCGAAEGDDVKSQIERLWQEVNSLKEMQALQTGTLLADEPPARRRGGEERRGIRLCGCHHGSHVT